MTATAPTTSTSTPAAAATMTELEWVRLRETVYPDEDQSGKLFRKIKENPFVPIGCLATAGALTYGLWAMRQGKARTSQNMMRMRIGAQGFTVVALLSGLFLQANTKKKPNEEKK